MMVGPVGRQKIVAHLKSFPEGLGSVRPSAMQWKWQSRTIPPTKYWTASISGAYGPGMPRLPPLSAVRVFEAAARRQNFTQAAAELGMTQAAVSYQIRLLEERLGVPLFARIKGRVSLTDAGRRIAPLVASAFETLGDAFSGLVAEDQALLSVSTAQTIATDLAGAPARRLPDPPPRSRRAAEQRQQARRFLHRRISRRGAGRPRRSGPA